MAGRDRIGAEIIPASTISDSSCPRLSRASTNYKHRKNKIVDGRDKPGHDDGREPRLKKLV
jgi:hypothetical protein